MQILDLQSDEVVIKEIKGDYWAGSLMYKQIRGVYLLTSKRFAFRAMTILGAAKHNYMEIDLSDIISVDKCMIGPYLFRFLPTGLRLTMRDGSKHRVSILSRGKLLEELTSRIS
ncbi:hypothetical protein acsn021_30630 [Anaerocolumna cellulosilytica]|uniref:Uncharacterized protein n=1 Tax=Anaerocolumna cellulosilytica TaxID=433286 RepID=A0A6S6QXY0_9FIRM|nr:hypothetical protein [Anaerocolumna cellulosilytica]MBB5197475.1 hypothetical protein [Anaerocolumna cellulosilytica]BCJ95494.1 hypothetical protein acsn021_30630 [Anaerocolumna cellulosilytica]